MDSLSDVLALVRLKGVVYFRTDFAAPWGFFMPAGGVAQFHLIVRGQCYLNMPGLMDRPLLLSTGDVVMFPRGAAHAIADSPDSEHVPGAQVMKRFQAGLPVFPGDGPPTTMVCGHFEFDRRFDHPLPRDLPDLVHLKSTDPEQRHWLESVTTAMIQETGSGRPGADAVVTKLAEVLFVQVLRAYMAQAEPTRGYLAGVRDRRIGEAMNIIHAGTDGELTLDGMARAVGMSRSAFAARFKELVGLTPMGYVTDWRMLKARELLERTAEPLERISAQVGYRSDAAFNRAFKRKFDTTPGAARRAVRA